MSKDYLLYNELEKDLTCDSKVFYVNGCSMAYGQELYGISEYTDVFNKFDFLPPDYHHERLKRCWAGHMHQALFPDHLFFNASQGGSSNHRIFRVTLTHINSMLQLGVKPENIFVVISFTNMLRLGLYDAKKENWIDLFLTLKYGGPEKHYNEFADLYLENFVAPKSVAIEALTNVLQMQSFLKSVGVKYALCEGIPMTMLSVDHNDRIELVDHTLYKAIDMSKWLMYNEELVSKTKSMWCSNFGSWSIRKQYPIGPNYHPLEDAHKAWANELIACIQNNKENFL